jgi:hypothetical protein
MEKVEDAEEVEKAGGGGPEQDVRLLQENGESRRREPGVLQPRARAETTLPNHAHFKASNLQISRCWEVDLQSLEAAEHSEDVGNNEKTRRWGERVWIMEAAGIGEGGQGKEGERPAMVCSSLITRHMKEGVMSSPPLHQPSSLKAVIHCISSNTNRISMGVVCLYPVSSRAHILLSSEPMVYMLYFEKMEVFPFSECQTKSKNQAISSLISTDVRPITMKLCSHVQ